MCSTASSVFGDGSMKFELLPDNRGADDAALLADLLQVARSLGKDSIPREKYDGLGRFHSATLARRFGGWNRAFEKAGLVANQNKNLTPQECLAEIIRVA